MTIQENVDQIIANAQTRAEQAQNQAINYTDLATSAASLQIVSLPSIDDLSSLSKPEFEPPDDRYGNLFSTLFTGTKNEILSQLDSDWNDFLNQYFPTSLNAAAQAWIEDAILNGGTGIGAPIEEAIYQRGRDRIEMTANAEEDRLGDQFSRLGWPAPPGAISGRIDRIRQEARTRIAEVNRDVTIKAADQEQENVQFAVRMSVDLVRTVWNAAGVFIGSVVRAYGPAVQAGDALARHTEEFYSQMIQYYRVLMAWEQLEDGHELTDINIAEREIERTIDVINKRANSLADAALSAAKTLGEMASSALQGQNTMAAQIVEEAV
jgi:hypothetical protein